jgi:hypothetical protein
VAPVFCDDNVLENTCKAAMPSPSRTSVGVLQHVLLGGTLPVFAIHRFTPFRLMKKNT